MYTVRKYNFMGLLQPTVIHNLQTSFTLARLPSAILAKECAVDGELHVSVDVNTIVINSCQIKNCDCGLPKMINEIVNNYYISLHFNDISKIYYYLQ